MTTQRQHYVPQFLLRRFIGNDTKQLYVLDKLNNKTFPSNPRKVAVKGNYYDFKFHGYDCTLEPALAELEDKASRHISRIIKDRKLNPSDPFERADLARFLAVQLVRTPAQKTMQNDLFMRLEAFLRSEGVPNAFFESDPAIGEGENAKRAMMARSICDASKEYAVFIAEKDWILFESDDNIPYMIWDHPLTMCNSIERLGRGNLGLKVEGIQLYFPLSPNLALCLMCPSYYKRFLNSIEEIANLSEINPKIPKQIINSWKSIIEMVECIQTGKPFKSTPEVVEAFNSLQISTAERFIFSSINDFSLAQDMIQKDKALRYGRRMQEAAGKF